MSAHSHSPLPVWQPTDTADLREQHERLWADCEHRIASDASEKE